MKESRSVCGLPLRIGCFVLGFVIMTAGQNNNNNLVFELTEEQKADTFVGNLAQQSGVQSEVSPGEVQNLRYQILTSDGLRISSLFTINIKSGLLYTNAMIDREQVCDSTDVTCKLEFDVTVKLDSVVLRILHVNVIIKDVNDNAPAFPVKILGQNISEAFPKGGDFSIPSAIDRDGQMDTSIIYWVEDNPTFGLKEEKLMGVSLLKVVLLRDLDREKENEYLLHIFARDGNISSSLTGTLTVVIAVIDVNDNRPQFTDPFLNFTVSEDAEVGSWVGTMNATDLDEGENGRITFQFSSFTSTKFRQLFDLDANTGRVTVKSDLKYESEGSFQAVIVAIDNGGSPKAAQAVLIINILDVGNTPPKLSLILVDPLNQNSTTLPEDLPGAWFVGTLRYQDNDKGDNGAVDCSSLNPHFALQLLPDSGYAIEIDAPLDREVESELRVVLKCSDHGTPSLSTFVNFTVRVADVNDNKPVFERPIYNASLREGERSQRNFLQVSATDRDEGANRELTFHLTTNTSGSFSIDPLTGWVSLIEPLDREKEPIIRLNVEAVDEGHPALTGSVTVVIVVEDVNDNTPVITRTNYQVRENQDPGTFVGQIVASDLDEGPNSELTFQLHTNSNTGFTVSQKGIITTTQTFDRETTDLYYIVVSVHDNGTPSLVSSSTLTINIADTNDHAPDIIFPRPGNNTVNVSAGLSPGAIITKVIAADSDAQNNGNLLYVIVEGNTKMFAIENATGTIFLAKRLATSQESYYRLTISVQDGGTPRLSRNTLLHISVDFVNVTIVDTASAMEQKYAIISGVIAGVTLITAVVVVTIILKLRRTDPVRCRERDRKSKNVNTAHSKIFSEVTISQVSTFKVDSTSKDMGAKDEKGRGHDAKFSLDRGLTNGSIPASYRPTLTRELLDRQTNGSFSVFLEGRDRLTSEDIHSDVSGDANASDSGRGTSDGDDVSSGVSLPPPYPQDTAVNKLKMLRLPSMENGLPTNPNRNFSSGPKTDQIIHQLPKSPLGIVHKRDMDTNRRHPNKVSFASKDERVDNNRFGGLQSHPSSGQQPYARPSRPYPDILRGQKLASPQHTPNSNLANNRFNEIQNRDNPNHQDPRPATRSHIFAPNSVPLSQDALAKHNLLQTTSQPPLNSNRFLSPNYNHYYHQHPAVVNQSGDDDDNNSTTTSGSYIVDDSVSTSVDC